MRKIFVLKNDTRNMYININGENVVCKKEAREFDTKSDSLSYLESISDQHGNDYFTVEKYYRNSTDSEETDMVKDLKNYLKSTPIEEQLKDWNDAGSDLDTSEGIDLNDVYNTTKPYVVGANRRDEQTHKNITKGYNPYHGVL